MLYILRIVRRKNEKQKFETVIQVPIQGDSCLVKEDKSGYYMVSPKNAKLFQQIEKFVFVEKGVVKFDSKKAEKEKGSFRFVVSKA